MLRRKRQPQPKTTDLLERWLPHVLAGSRGDLGHVEEACRDVVEALDERFDGQLAGALTRFGRQLGSEGWSLSEVTRWIAGLTELAGASGVVLDRFESGVELSRGWASGYMRGAQDGECVDGLTGLVTVSVLRLRLRQIYEQCTALGVATDQVYCLVVVDTDLAERTQIGRAHV